ncbi:MAG TPA: sugar ABC transporter substrate-binding protein [Chloroflexota bacterium]|nr:sugar ABC transporter substrate-binding protein [Chloroflexota bacterium]
MQGKRTIRRRAALAGAGGGALGGLAPVIVACGQAGQGPPAAPAAPRRDVTLEWLAGANATEEQIYRQIAAAFEAAQPPLKVSFINGNSTEGGWQVKLETMAAAGTPPDVAWHGPEWFPGVASKGLYRSIDGYLAKQPRAEVADFFPRVMEQYQWEGKQLGLPASITVMTLFYNKDLFDREGIAYPDSSWTYEGHFLDAARRLTKRQGERTVQFGVGNPHRDWIWPYAGGAEYLDKSGTQVILHTNPESARWFQFAADLRTRHRVAPTVAEQREMQGGTRNFFLTGQVAIDTEGNWTLSDRKLVTSFTWDVAPIPMGSKARPTPFFSTADMVCAGSKNPDEAFALCLHIANPDSERVLAAEFGRIPARKSLWSYFIGLDNGRPPRSRKVIVDALEYASSAPRFKDFREFDSQILAPRMTQLNEGQINAQQMITEMVPLLQALAK